MELQRVYRLLTARSLGRVLSVTRERSLHTTTPRLLLPKLPREMVHPPHPIQSAPLLKKNVTINLLPLWKGQTRQGVRYGPAVLLSKVKELTSADVQVNFIADYTLNDKITNENFLETMTAVSRDLGEAGDDELIMNIGGDHAIPMMTIPIMLKKHPNLKVVWIDAHADINSPDSSPSGNYHGMPIYFLTTLSGEEEEGKLKLDNLVYVGVRETDPVEKALMEKHQIRNYDKAEIDGKGVHAVAHEIIQRLQLDKSPVHISFDIDALDPSLAPSTGTKVPEGLSVEDVVHIFKEIKKTGNLVSCDIVEFNPLLGSEEDVETTISSIAPVLKEIL